jgi:hypothetical protein
VFRAKPFIYRAQNRLAVGGYFLAEDFPGLGRRGRCFAEMDLMMSRRFCPAGIGTFARISAS